MTYLDMLKEFFVFCEGHRVSGNAQLLFHTLLMINNRCFWDEWFFRTNNSLCGLMNIGEKALINARNELKQYELIDFVTSKKRGQSTKYSILYNTKAGTNAVQTQYKGSTEEVQTADIIRYKTETKTKKDIPSGISQKSKRFVPPTVDQVREYCQERGNTVDPERFVAFYSSKGWMVGRNKMKDWKASVRTWERNADKSSQANSNSKSNGWNGFEGRNYDSGFYSSIEESLAGGR